jgi:hypothetical protein
VVSKIRSIGMFLVAVAMASCGGGGGFTGGGGSGANVATVQLVASASTLNSDAAGNSKVNVTAVVKDSGNAVIASVPVVFNATSGALTVLNSTTDVAGSAKAEITNGLDPTNRAITVSASAGGQTGTVAVNVVGTSISVSGPSALALGDTGTYTIQLRDSSGAGISGRLITVGSTTGNTLSAASLTTNLAGQATVNVTATAAGTDTLAVTALGQTASQAIVVSGDIFAFQVPTTAQEINLGAVQNVRVRWTKAGVPQGPGQTINFSSTRGTLSSNTATTDANGDATVTLSSTTAGAALITATNPDSTTTTVGVEFIAVRADAIELQATRVNVGITQQSTITATVRDVGNNLVKNKLVNFSLSDSTGGSLSVGTAFTDSLGRASTVYTAGSTPSAPGGVTITSTVNESAPPATIQETLGLTVVGQAVDMAIGSGDVINLPAQSLYSKEWAIIVTDTAGTAPIAGATVQASVRSVRYYKGFLEVREVLGGEDDWVQVHDADTGPAANAQLGGFQCTDEDTDRDGFLDPLEDLDADNKLEAGNRASVVALAPGADADACGDLTSFGGSTANVITNSSGIARVCVVYARSDNLWVDVELKALLNVFGSEFTESTQFNLDALAADIADETSAPAGQVSPWGREGSCSDPD